MQNEPNGINSIYFKLLSIKMADFLRFLNGLHSSLSSFGRRSKFENGNSNLGPSETLDSDVRSLIRLGAVEEQTRSNKGARAQRFAKGNSRVFLADFAAVRLCVRLFRFSANFLIAYVAEC